MLILHKQTSSLTRARFKRKVGSDKSPYPLFPPSVESLSFSSLVSLFHEYDKKKIKRCVWELIRKREGESRTLLKRLFYMTKLWWLNVPTSFFPHFSFATSRLLSRLGHAACSEPGWCLMELFFPIINPAANDVSSYLLCKCFRNFHLPSSYLCNIQE